MFKRITRQEMGGVTYFTPEVMADDGPAKWTVGDLHRTPEAARLQLSQMVGANLKHF